MAPITEKEYIAKLDNRNIRAYTSYKAMTAKQLEKQVLTLSADLEDADLDEDIKQATKECLEMVQFIQQLKSN